MSLSDQWKVKLLGRPSALHTKSARSPSSLVMFSGGRNITAPAKLQKTLFSHRIKERRLLFVDIGNLRTESTMRNNVHTGNDEFGDAGDSSFSILGRAFIISDIVGRDRTNGQAVAGRHY